MTLTCYLLPPSPNNVKVLLALAYKGIAYDTVLVNPAERSAVIEATGQPLTPAIVHDGTKLFDSSAIMRYIDVNFPGPRLFSEDYQTMKAIEGWERYMRVELGPFVGRTFAQLFAETKDAAEIEAINAGMNAVTAKLEEHLDGREWLVGEAPTAADFTVAAFVCIACMDAEHATHNDFWGWMCANLDLGEGRDRTREWMRRVMVHLPSPALQTS